MWTLVCFSSLSKIVLSLGSCVDVAGALVIKDSSAFSFRGKDTSSTGISGSVSAFMCSFPFPHPALHTIIIAESPIANNAFILFFIIINLLSSAFYRTNHNALVKIFLEEWIHDQKR